MKSFLQNFQVPVEKVLETLLDGVDGNEKPLNYNARTKLLAAGIYLLYAEGRVCYADCFNYIKYVKNCYILPLFVYWNGTSLCLSDQT